MAFNTRTAESIREAADGQRSFGLDRFRSGFLAKAAILGVAVFGALPATAEAANNTIVVGRGVAGINIGATSNQVEAKLGKPFGSDKEGQDTILRYGKPFLGTFTLKHNEVTVINAYSKTERTNLGVGPGSSYEKTTEAYPDANCFEGASGSQSSTCQIVTKGNGETVTTDFVFPDTSQPMVEVDIEKLK